jgi:alkylhydroperoxidase family enzyme
MEAQQATFGFVLNPLKLMGYCPTIVEGQTALAQGIEQAGHIEARLRYLLYTFVASLNGCPFWLDINAFRGMQAGLSAAQVADLHTYTTSAQFSTRERLALTYAERITRSDQDVDEALFAQLQSAFQTPAALVELTATIAFENFRSKFNHALRIESNGICRLMPPGA